ncbi:MFS transporter [Roseomonas gilardii]|uniref:MFS transporter n=1 Tax=Roseomonas gilardii TaxID=257708 RepID=UPI0021B5B28A|nr:MFS transporter [Roseomonas gilardii]
MKREFGGRATSVTGLYAAAMAATAGLSAGIAVPLAGLPSSNWRWAIAASAVLALVTLLAWIPQWKGRQHHLSASADSTARAQSPWTHAIGWYVSLFFALHSIVFYSLVDWFASYGAAYGISSDAAGIYLFVYQIVAVATNLGSAPIIRKVKDQMALGFVCGVLLIIGTIGLLVLPSMAFVWIIFAGLGAGTSMVYSLSLFALRTQDHHQAASLSGMAQFVGYVGAASGPILVGVLHDLSGAWTAPMIMLIVASGLAGVFGALAGRNRVITDKAASQYSIPDPQGVARRDCSGFAEQS